MITLSLPKIIISFINFVFGFIVFGLSLRFILRLFGANPDSSFMEFIYNSTSPLLEPFRGLFQPYVIEKGSVLEFTTLFSILMYMIVAWLLVEFVLFVSYNAKNTYRRK
ncbi:YggT family protein [Candidatus Dojkabacteria bacterium]|uniref:YggT family protein n=1 Tax=Candidatus Dojkabacteria bacterium TaxID=2099670 RepID=A0A955LBL4_9BACT|nr:YggT family protein [Candidatus Dojkabacteria bacterium]